MAIIDRRGIVVDDEPSSAGSFIPSANLAIKTPCRVATTANITLSGLQTIDDVTVVADDRVLVKNQSSAVDNGIYTASSGNWQRTTDFDSPYETVKGTQVLINEGTIGAGLVYVVTSSNPLIPGTSSLSFSVSTAYQAGDADLTALAALSSTGIARRTGSNTWAVGALVTNAELATVAAYTIKGNATGSTAAPTDISIPALTQKATPVAADKVMVADSAASNALKYATLSSIISSLGVASIAGNVGAFTLGTGLTNSTNDIRVVAGTVIGTGYGSYATSTALNTTIPIDDTIPQSSEGTQIISVSYTPKVSTSTLYIWFQGQTSSATTGEVITAAIFNGGANAIGANSVNTPTANYRVPITCAASYAPGTTSAQTISVRVGGGTVAVYMNGNSSGRFLGGQATATLRIEEVL